MQKPSGRVILLQGPSSSGKSTLAVALQKNLPEHWWVLEADDITRMQATSERTDWWRPEPGERTHPSWSDGMRLEQWLAGYWNCLRTIALTGSDVIAVGGWLETSWLYDLAEAMTGLEAYCVGVTCPIEELERRELGRGDRSIGYSRSHYEASLADGPFDLMLDSFLQTEKEMVEAIRDLLANPPTPTFFEKVQDLEK